MSSFNRQQINSIANGTQGSSAIDVNTTVGIVDPTTMYSMYAALNATIDAYAAASATASAADTTNSYDTSNDDVLKRLETANNDTDDDGLLRENHVFDRTDVRAIFIIMYSLVFCCCFFGEYK